MVANDTIELNPVCISNYERSISILVRKIATSLCQLHPGDRMAELDPDVTALAV